MSPPQVPAESGVSGHHRGGRADWKPSEYRDGRAKWRDPGTYVDGVPVGFLHFGDLPLSATEVWLDDYRSLDHGPDDPGPREEKIKVRRYRLADYLEGRGVNLAKVRAVHIYGGRGFPAVVSGAEFRRVRDTFYFSFGRDTSGKPRIHFPAGLKTNTTFDHIVAIAVYIAKTPPTLRDDGELELAGEIQNGIPYFGEPLRGGVRVYRDDRLALLIKRRRLKEADGLAEKGPDGDSRWPLMRFLDTRGVDVSKIVQGIVIRGDRRVERLTRVQLDELYFAAHPQASGEILLGGDASTAEVLAFYSHDRPIPMEIAQPPPVEPDKPAK